MDKVTQVNIEGQNYGFIAGQAVSGVCSASAADYIKTVVVAGGSGLIDGMLIVVKFTYGNTAGFEDVRTVYSSDGENFYTDEEMTNPLVLPPPGCYTLTHMVDDMYEYMAYPVLDVDGIQGPYCDSRGHPMGGNLWIAGDEVPLLYVDGMFIDFAKTDNEAIKKLEANVSQIVDCKTDVRVFAVTADITLTLGYSASYNLNEATIIAVTDCDVVYNTDENTTATKHLAAGTRITLTFRNGWMLSGIYNAVWN